MPNLTNLELTLVVLTFTFLLTELYRQWKPTKSSKPKHKKPLIPSAGVLPADLKVI